MASEQHVEEVSSNEDAEKPTRKIEKTILDNFSNLVKPQEKIRIKSSVNLLRHLAENRNNENAIEVKYALGRIIRGLGSSTVSARTGFYTALVGLINLKDDITVEDIFQHVEKELHKAGSNTKGENADVCVGHILTCGAIMRSKLWAKCSNEERNKIIEMLLKSSKERTYLTLVAYMFIVDKFEEMDESEFKLIFQLIKAEFSKPWAELNIDTLYLLMCVKNKNSNYVKSTFLQKTIGTNDIICSESLEELSDILTTIPRVTAVKHPVYEIVSKDLATSTHLTDFAHALDRTLQKPNRNKQLIVTRMYSLILQNVKNLASIPDLLTKNFIQQTLNYFKTFKGKQKDAEFQQSMNRFFEALLNTLKRQDVQSATKIGALKKLLFYPGTFIFEKITRSKIAQQITSSLDIEGVKTLATLYEGVINGTERIDSQNSQNENWLNNDRLYAAHLLIKLLNHAAARGENEWKTEKLSFLMNLALTKNNINIGSELAASLKTAFFGALDMKLSKLEDLQGILSRLVRELDTKLTAENLETLLRNPVNPETYETWRKTMEAITRIEKKKKKGGLRSVFLTLFLHMGLQLLNNAKLAWESLEELFVCYEKTRKSRTNSENSEENAEETGIIGDPAWIEVVTDLFLNLLSHNSHLLRSLIRSVFPHLCQYMTPTTIHQILSVIDPKNEDNPLSKRTEDSGEEDDESEEDEGSSEEDERNSEEDDEEEDGGDETVNDRLRMALHQVLSKDGHQTDDESIDLDQLSETEGEKLDEAIAGAFRQFRPNLGRRKKQTRDQETLTHFRVRVLDLIEIYLDAEPSMHLVLEIMLPLLQAVEFSVRDEYQRPLRDRLRVCLKKLSQLKKFGEVDGVDEVVLGELLRSLLEKGTKNSLIVQEMGVQIADCCVFVVRCSDLLASLETTPKKVGKQLKRAIVEILSEELRSYFHKRDCLTPYVLFKNTVQLAWDGTLSLVPLLLGYVFSNDVKPFKKNQALELLRLFYNNHRFLSINPEKTAEKLSQDHTKFFQKTNTLFKTLSENPEKNRVKEKFITNLFSLLSAMKTGRLTIETDWKEIAENVREYRTFITLSKDAKSAFNKLCNHLNVSHLVKMKPKTVKINNSVNENDSEDEQKPENIIKKKKKKKNLRNKETAKLKKEAKELRLNSLSEGFRDLDFVSARDIETNGDDGMETNEGDEPQKSKSRKSDSSSNSTLYSEKKRKKKAAAYETEDNVETEGDKPSKKKKRKNATEKSAMEKANVENGFSKSENSEEIKPKKKKKLR